MNALEWFVIVGPQDVILGVYGSALLDMAQDRQKRIAADNPTFHFSIETVQGPRPRTGDTYKRKV